MSFYRANTLANTPTHAHITLAHTHHACLRPSSHHKTHLTSSKKNCQELSRENYSTHGGVDTPEKVLILGFGETPNIEGSSLPLTAKLVRQQDSPTGKDRDSTQPSHSAKVL